MTRGGNSKLRIIVDATTDGASKEMQQLTKDLKGADAATDALNASQKKLAADAKGTKFSFTEMSSAINIAQQAMRVAGQVYDETAGKALAYAEQVRSLSRTIGASAEDTSKLIQAADDTKVSYESLTSAMEIAIRKGVRPTVDGMGELADEYLSIQDPIARTKFLMDKFGKSGADLAPLMEKGAKGIRELGDAAEDVGLVLSEQDLVAAREFEIALDNLGDTATGLKVKLGNDLIPPLTQLADALNRNLGYTNLYNEAVRAGIVTAYEAQAAQLYLLAGWNLQEGGVADVTARLDEYNESLRIAGSDTGQYYAELSTYLPQQDRHSAALSSTAGYYADMQGAIEAATKAEHDQAAQAEITAARVDDMRLAAADAALAYNDLAGSLMDATSADIARVSIENLDQALLDGSLTTWEHKRATEAVMLQYELATPASLAMATATAQLNQLFISGTISQDQLTAAIGLMPAAAENGQVSMDELGITLRDVTNPQLVATKDAALTAGSAIGQLESKEITITSHFINRYTDVNNLASASAAKPGRAAGGRVEGGGVYTVGEQGAERFVAPPRGGYILDHRDAMEIASGNSGGGTVVNVNVDARGATDPAAVEAAGYRGAQRALQEANLDADRRRRIGTRY